MICLRENVNGVLLSMRTYYRHRKNQLEFSDVEETHIIHQERDLENIQQDEIQQQDEMQHMKIYINRMRILIILILMILRVLTLMKKTMNTILIMISKKIIII